MAGQKVAITAQDMMDYAAHYIRLYLYSIPCYLHTLCSYCDGATHSGNSFIRYQQKVPNGRKTARDHTFQSQFGLFEY